MAVPKSPKQPLVVILGSTGTGKSELAVELALRFQGEVINSDAMQLYDGLPIITNKITPEEQRGIPHHLLGNISLEQPPWAVDRFKREADRVIGEIRSRGNLPIIVGGTQYYVDPLLFKDVTLNIAAEADQQSHPILQGPTEAMLDKLREVDPVMADRWHPNDRRKIQRSLSIYLSTGRKASELYEEQQQRKQGCRQGEGTWENLLFWVCAEKETLSRRLDARVDKMVESGVLGEARSLYQIKQEQAAMGHDPDLTKGIWQSIGYKQLERYFQAEEHHVESKELEMIKAQGLEDMKTATRRYANYQNRWTRLQQIPLLKERGPAAVNSLYVLDSTEAGRYNETVIQPAAELTQQFLEGRQRKEPRHLSAFARDTLEKAMSPAPNSETVICRRTCEVCGTVCVTEKSWNQHVKSSSHRRAVKRRQKLALVPVAGDQGITQAQYEASEEGEELTIGLHGANLE